VTSTSVSTHDSNENSVPVTAIVSFFKNVSSSDTSIASHLPSLPLKTPLEESPTKARFSALWPTDYDPNGNELSTFRCKRMMKKEIVAGHVDYGFDNDETQYVPERIHFKVGLNRGSDIITVGAATMMITGDEINEVQVNLPISTIRKNVKSNDSNGLSLKRNGSKLFSKSKNLKIKPKSFANDPRRKYSLHDNSCLKVMVKVTASRNHSKAQGVENVSYHNILPSTEVENVSYTNVLPSTENHYPHPSSAESNRMRDYHSMSSSSQSKPTTFHHNPPPLPPPRKVNKPQKKKTSKTNKTASKSQSKQKEESQSVLMSSNLFNCGANMCHVLQQPDVHISNGGQSTIAPMDYYGQEIDDESQFLPPSNVYAAVQSNSGDRYLFTNGSSLADSSFDSEESDYDNGSYIEEQVENKPLRYRNGSIKKVSSKPINMPRQEYGDSVDNNNYEMNNAMQELSNYASRMGVDPTRMI